MKKDGILLFLHLKKINGSAWIMNEEQKKIPWKDWDNISYKLQRSIKKEQFASIIKNY